MKKALSIVFTLATSYAIVADGPTAIKQEGTATLTQQSQKLTNTTPKPAIISEKMSSVSTEKSRIGIVDSYAVVGTTTEGIRVREELTAARKKAEEELARKQQEINQKGKEFEAKVATLNDKTKREDERKLTQSVEDLKEYAEELKLKLEQDMTEKMQKLGSFFEEVVTLYGKENQLDLVIDKTTGRVVYAKDNLECTKDIAELMNKRTSSDKKQATTVAQNSKPASVKTDRKG